MTKRRRSGETYVELLEGQGREDQAIASAEGATVARAQPAAALVARVATEIEVDGHQLVDLGSADVARERAASPRRIEGVVPNQSQTAVNEEGTTGELELPSHEQILANRLREEEADVAGQDPAEPHWFWELLAEAGYDVW